MQSISLQQPYEELTDLECLLNDAPRRMELAQEYDYLRTPLRDGFHVVASGFSALAAVEGLRRCGPVTAVYDPSESLDTDIFPDVDVLPFDKLKNAHKGIVVAVNVSLLCTWRTTASTAPPGNGQSYQHTRLHHAPEDDQTLNMFHRFNMFDFSPGQALNMQTHFFDTMKALLLTDMSAPSHDNRTDCSKEDGYF